MFTKLVKYDFKSMFRTIAPLLLAFIVVGLLAGFTLPGVDNGNSALVTLAGGVLVILLVGLTVAVYVTTLIVVIRRFYKNLLGDEGYLTFTLPVGPFKILMSKALTAYVCTFISFIAGCISYFLLFFVFVTRSEGLPSFTEFIEKLGHYLGMIDFNAWSVVAIFVVTVLVQAYTKIVKLYAAMMIGHQFNDHRVFLSFVSYIVLSVIESVCSQVFILVTGTSQSLMGDIEVNTANGIFDISGTPSNFLIIALLFDILLAVIYTTVTYILMRDRLNLE